MPASMRAVHATSMPARRGSRAASSASRRCASRRSCRARASAEAVHRAPCAACASSRAVDAVLTAPPRTSGGRERLASSHASAYSCAIAHGVPRAPRAATRIACHAAPRSAARSLLVRLGGTNATTTEWSRPPPRHSPARAKRADTPVTLHCSLPRRGSASRCAISVAALRCAPVAPAASGASSPKSVRPCWSPAGTHTSAAPPRTVMGMTRSAGERVVVSPSAPSLSGGTSEIVGMARALVPVALLSAHASVLFGSRPSGPGRTPALRCPELSPPAPLFASGASSLFAALEFAASGRTPSSRARSASARRASPAPRAETDGMVAARPARLHTRWGVLPRCEPPSRRRVGTTAPGRSLLPSPRPRVLA
eukprot:164659-Pleurochrysis_carterae.AAC.1